MLRRFRWIPIALAAVAVGLGFAASSRAEQSPSAVSGWEERLEEITFEEAHPAPFMTADGPDFYALPTLAQTRGVTTCDKVYGLIFKPGFTEPEYIMSDAELWPGSPGNRLCVYWDRLSENYILWPLNVANLAQFRQLKTDYQPLLAEAGVDPCRIAYWAVPVARNTQVNWNDFHDVGQVCEPEIIPRGPISERRIDEVKRSLDIARAKTEEIFGWPLTWPLRIHLYDNSTHYVEGVRVDAGVNQAAIAKQSAGMYVVQSSKMTIIALDGSTAPTEADMLKLVLHEYHHATQGGYLGNPGAVPYFATEGGADYFSSMVVGQDSKSLNGRFLRAIADVHAEKATPLSKLIKPTSGVTLAAYTRGYAMYRFLEMKLGPDAFVRLNQESINGTPEQFLFLLSHYTELTLEELDRELNDWLRTFPNPSPTKTPTPGRTPTPARTPTPPR